MSTDGESRLAVPSNRTLAVRRVIETTNAGVATAERLGALTTGAVVALVVALATNPILAAMIVGVSAIIVGGVIGAANGLLRPPRRD